MSADLGSKTFSGARLSLQETEDVFNEAGWISSDVTEISWIQTEVLAEWTKQLRCCFADFEKGQ